MKPDILPTFYWTGGSNAGLLTVNTQARRLGVVGYLLRRIDEGAMTISTISRCIAPQLDALRENLKGAGLHSGWLTKNPSSLRHYLDLMCSIGLLRRRGETYTQTALGQVATFLGPMDFFVYPLSASFKTAMLYFLLRQDAIGIQILLNRIQESPVTLSECVTTFQPAVEQTFKEFLHSEIPAREKNLLIRRREQVKKWQKPEKYAEHLVHARINWLYDLGLIRRVGEGQLLKVGPPTGCLLAIKNQICELGVPRASQVIEIVLEYSSALHDASTKSDGDGDIESCLCENLQEAFQVAGGKQKVHRVAAEVLVLYLISACPKLLLRADMAGIQIFPNGSRHCGASQYHWHPAARSSQSYVIRTYT